MMLTIKLLFSGLTVLLPASSATWSWKPLLSRSTLRSRRCWTRAVGGGGAAAESLAIGYGGDALVSSATGLARETISTRFIRSASVHSRGWHRAS